ncbi:MAG: hypothetical protein AAGB93_11190 [Planctomycetota bacterium]
MAGLLLCAVGCIAPPEPSAAATRIEWIEPTANLAAFRLRVDELYDRFHDGFALAVERASEVAETQEQQAEVTLWGNRATAQARECLFRADPLAGLFDAWLLTRQLDEQLTSEAAAARYGPGTPILRATLSDLEGSARGIAESVARDGDVEELFALVEKSAADHPIRGEVSTRTAAVLENAESAAGHAGVVDVAAAVERRVQQLTRLTVLLASEVPELVRTEVEMALGPRLDRLIDSTDRAVAVAETLPDVVAREREALLAEVSAQRVETLAFLDGQRESMVGAFVAERTALVAALGTERGILLDEFDRQRRQTLELVTAERLAVIDAIGLERQRAIDEVAVRLDEAPAAAKEVVDHVFLRLVQVAVVLGLALAIGFGAYKAVARP